MLLANSGEPTAESLVQMLIGFAGQARLIFSIEHPSSVLKQVMGKLAKISIAA